MLKLRQKVKDLHSQHLAKSEEAKTAAGNFKRLTPARTKEKENENENEKEKEAEVGYYGNEMAQVHAL